MTRPEKSLVVAEPFEAAVRRLDAARHDERYDARLIATRALASRLLNRADRLSDLVEAARETQAADRVRARMAAGEPLGHAVDALLHEIALQGSVLDALDETAVADPRELAERHPDLLMRACWCGDLEPHDDNPEHQGDYICECRGSGRRPLALEEALDALVEKEVGRVPRTTRRLAMYRVLHRLSEAVYDSPDRDARYQPREAAYRLLIEVSNRAARRR